MIGTTISHFRIQERLGGGSMGVVYRAEDVRDGKPVAFKFLPFDLRDDPEARDAFVEEAEATSDLEHPNLCTIYEIGETDQGRMFVAMAFYEGETLKKRLERGPLDLPEAISCLRQVADGLGCSHRKGIIHRDIKPANVILQEDGVVKIVDFGLARVVSQGQPGLTQIGASMGTPSYMSPEQTLGDVVDHRSDLWSLGVVFYESLTGELPFDGPNLPSVIQSIHGKEPTPPRQLVPEIPAVVESAVLRLLAKKPEDRFDSCEELLAALDGKSEARNGSVCDGSEARAAAAAGEANDDIGDAAPSGGAGAEGKGSGLGCLALVAVPLIPFLAWLLL